MGMMGGGKGGGIEAPTIDIEPALKSFQKGADAIAAQYPIALQYFQQSLGDSMRTTSIGFAEAQGAAFPFTDTARQSMNELRGFLGMAPIDEAQGIKAKVDALGDFLRTPGIEMDASIGNVIAGLGNKLEAANNLTDAAERAEARQGILTEIKDIKYGVQQDLNEYRKVRYGDTSRKIDKDAKYYGHTGLVGQASELRTKLDAAEKPTTAMKKVKGPFGMQLEVPDKASASAPVVSKGQLDNAAVGKVDHTVGVLADLKNKLDDITTDVETKYEPTLGKALTGEEITQKLESMPGYQFQFGEGQKALERSQAARGELASGKAMVEATQYGQKFAQNAYQSHLGNLSSLAGLNIPFAQGSIGMHQQLGQALAGQSMIGGQMQYQNVQGIADARQGAFNLSGQAQTQAAVAQAQLQMEAAKANAAAQQESAGGFGQLLGTIAGRKF